MTESTPSLARVRHRFEKEASEFDAIYRLERSTFWRWFNVVFRKAIFERYRIAFAEASDLAGKSVLDIGCGSGVYAADFARRGARRVLGVDFSSNMLRLARERAANEGVAHVCEFVEGDFLDVHLREEFDVAIAMGVFDYLPAPLPFLRKMASVTRGKIIASFPGRSLVRNTARRLRYRVQGKGDVYFYSEPEVRELARDAGFQSIRVVPIRSSGSGSVLVVEN